MLSFNIHTLGRKHQYENNSEENAALQFKSQGDGVNFPFPVYTSETDFTTLDFKIKVRNVYTFTDYELNFYYSK